MTIAIVPARGGSKGLPRKNLRTIGGRSLVDLAIQAALAAARIDRVVLSTDDDAIAAAGRAAGAEVPFRRPRDLASDGASTIDVVRHAVREIESAGGEVSVVVTLQPTSPLRTAAEIDAAVALLDDPDTDSAATVTSLGVPWSIVGYERDGHLVRGQSAADDERRQASPVAVRLTGAIYVTRRALLDDGVLIGPRAAALVTPATAAIDIDDAADLRRARHAAKARA